MNNEQKYLLIKAERSLNADEELNNKNSFFTDFQKGVKIEISGIGGGSICQLIQLDFE